MVFNEDVSQTAQISIDGTLSNLYARIDRVASPGTKAHEYYRRAVEEILGVLITTSSSRNGKQAGYYFDDFDFVPLDQMGDGVAEIVALLADLSLAHNKVFILEEPETNLHPAGLKSLLKLIRISAKHNQFIIATHSNIVVRELGVDDSTRVYRVFRDGDVPNAPSKVELIERSPTSHLNLLRELGYEFGDFDLHDAWLFLEEASAERIIRDVLVPWFVPALVGRLRTFSAGGADNVEPSIVEFQRLVTFVHLSPIYRERMWVRVDGDDKGKCIVASIVENFPYLGPPKSACFSKDQFEYYYPKEFFDRVEGALSEANAKIRRKLKKDLLEEVIDWTKNNEDIARTAWQESAAEQIEMLKMIAEHLEFPRQKSGTQS